MAHPSPKRYDVILAGGGAAGLSLAYHLRQAIPGISMLIVDEVVKKADNHAWCYWHRGASYLDSIAFRVWNRLAVVGDQAEAVFDLAPYHYSMVRASDFRRFVHAALAASPRVEFLLGSVESIAESADQTEIVVNGQPHTGTWAFDSRYRAAEYRPSSRQRRHLTQHFVGWEIETEDPTFDTGVPRLFDFRTPQAGAMRFLYTLPFTETRALVEYTIFSSHILGLETYRAALRTYIGGVLNVRKYSIIAEERDLIPMMGHSSPRRVGRRVLNIGTRGGRVKPSSGYAFERIQRDAAAITQSLLVRGHPFDLPKMPRRYRAFDAMLLEILHRRGEDGKPIFLQLFRRNPIQRIFRFLDEEGGLRENLQLMVTVPPLPFIRAWLSLRLPGAGIA